MLRMQIAGPSAAFTFDRKETASIPYSIERSRGYEWQGSLWSPGYFRTDLAEGEQTAVGGVHRKLGHDSCPDSREHAIRRKRDRRKLLLAAAVPEARSGAAAEFVLAADQFLITPGGPRGRRGAREGGGR